MDQIEMHADAMQAAMIALDTGEAGAARGMAERHIATAEAHANNAVGIEPGPGAAIARMGERTHAAAFAAWTRAAEAVELIGRLAEQGIDPTAEQAAAEAAIGAALVATAVCH